MSAQLVAEGGRGDPGDRDDEDGVLARHGGEHVRMVGLVDRVAERSREAARREDDDERVARLDRERPAAEGLLELAQAIEVRRALLLVDERPARGAHLDEPELGDVPRDGRLDSFESRFSESIDQYGLGRELLLFDQAQDRALALAAVLCHALSTSWRIEIAW